MQLSGCLKVQIDDKDPQIFVITDVYTHEVESVVPLSEDNTRLVALMSNIFFGVTTWHDSIPVALPTSDRQMIGDYRLELNGLNYVGYTFEAIKYALTDELLESNDVVSVNEFTELMYNATPDTLQSIIDTYAVGPVGLIINTSPSVVKFLPCTQSEIDALRIDDQNNPHVDAYDYLLSSINNTSTHVADMGFLQAQHDTNQDCIIFNTQCSFVLPPPDFSNF